MGGICRVGWKLFAVAMAAMLCAGMWGCSDWFPEDGEKEFTGHYIKGNAKVIGFVDDSLVIVYDYQYWNQELADKSQITGMGKQRLRVFNYRVQEDGPRWADTLDNMVEDYNYVRGQLADSVIWGGKDNKSFSFWKLGETPIVKDVKIKKEGCSADFGYLGVRSLRTWLKGTILAMGENSLNAGGSDCQYAVLDTVARTLVYKRLEENLKWIEKCDDVRALGDDVYCLGINEERNGFGLFVDDELKDSVLVDSVANVSSLWLSFEFEFMGDMIYFGHNINSIDYEKQKIKIYPNVKATSALNFVDENDNNVNYDF